LSDAVKGDILYLFGEFKSKQALPLLRAASSDPNAEIREAAAEALEKIDSSR
jgi:HEAT repeat protein